MTNKRREELFNNLCEHVVEATSSCDLLNTLYGIGFSDEEIRECDMEYVFDSEDDD